MADPASLRSQLSDAIFSTVHGGLRILGGMVQVAAGVTRLLAITAIKAVEAAEAIVEATEVDEEEPMLPLGGSGHGPIGPKRDLSSLDKRSGEAGT